MSPPGNLPQNPTLYTAINLTYKGVDLQLNAHDLMKFTMKQQDLLLHSLTSQETLPAEGNAKPQDWFSLNTKLNHLNLAGHRINIDSEQYTTFAAKTEPDAPEVDLETKIIDHLENVIRMLYLQEQNNLDNIMVPPIGPAMVSKNLFQFWQKLIVKKDPTEADPKKLDGTNYPAFAEIVNEVQRQQKDTTENLLEELSLAISSKEFIKSFLSDFEKLTHELLATVAARFAGDEPLKIFFEKISKGIIDFIQQKEVKDFIDKAKASSTDFDQHLYEMIKFLEKKHKDYAKTPEELNFNLSLKNIITMLRGVLNASLLEHLGNNVLVEEMRRILTNPRNTDYHFLPTLVATLFFSETNRRNFQDMYFSSLVLFDLIQAKALLPGTHDYYTLENALNNIAPKRDFVMLYREQPADFIARTFGNHPGAHKYSYKDAMKKRAPLFKAMLEEIKAKQLKTDADAKATIMSDKLKNAKISTNKKIQDTLNIFEDKASKANNQAKNATENLEKAKKQCNKMWTEFEAAPKLDLVEQKIAHLMIHWLSFHLDRFNAQAVQLYADQFTTKTPEQEALIKELLTSEILPLIKERLENFDCMLPEHLAELSNDTFAQMQELLTPLLSDTSSEADEDVESVIDLFDNEYTDGEDNKSAIDLWSLDDVYSEKEDPEETVKEESLPSPILATKSLMSYSTLNFSNLSEQSTATGWPLSRNFISNNQQKNLDVNFEQEVLSSEIDASKVTSNFHP